MNASSPVPQVPLTVELRRASAADARLLFEFANRPDSLGQKLATTAPIPWDTHVAWLNRRLSDPATRLFIIEVEGVPAGQVRLQAEADGVAEVDIYVTPDRRGSGFAKWAIEEAVLRWNGPHGLRALRARVKPDNAPSLALFGALDFAIIQRRSDHIVYERRCDTAMEKPS